MTDARTGRRPLAALERYVRFASSGAGHWYTALTRRAIVEAVGVAADRTAEALVRAVPIGRLAGAATPMPGAPR